MRRAVRLRAVAAPDAVTEASSACRRCAAPKRPLRVAAYDYGIKTNILRRLAAYGCDVRVFPASTPAAELLAWKPDGIFLSNGPGDPAALTYAIDNIKELAKTDVPTFGICLGHQMIGLALGAKTYKLKFGHRGGNHPVKQLETGEVEITSQNHGFAVDPDSLPSNVNVTHLESVRRHGRRVAPHRASRSSRCSTIPRRRRVRTTRTICSRSSSTRWRRSQPLPKRTDIKRVLVIGSGPIVIGQACEFDYSGTQAMQGAAQRRPRSGPGQQQPGDDHDRPGAGGSHLRRAADARSAREDHRARSGRTRCCRPSAARPRSTSRCSSTSSASSRSTTSS